MLGWREELPSSRIYSTGNGRAHQEPRTARLKRMLRNLRNMARQKIDFARNLERQEFLTEPEAQERRPTESVAACC